MNWRGWDHTHWINPGEVSGRPYKDLKNVDCFECHRTARELAHKYEFLNKCLYVGCRALLCLTCRPDHEALHQLAQLTEEPAKDSDGGNNA